MYDYLDEDLVMEFTPNAEKILNQNRLRIDKVDLIN